jgi:hypothetical protein
MDFMLLLKAPGYIFGPLMLLAGVAAVVACARASWRPDRAARRRAVAWALVPLALGVVGATYGAVRWGLSGQVAQDRAFVWGLLGYTVLFGALVAALPLAWAAALVRRRPVAPA